MTVNFKERLQRRDRLIGTILTLPVPELAEICSDAGFDWLFLDMEHGLLDPSDVQRICQVVGDRCACLARIPVNEEVWIKKVLDVGVAGLIVPLVNTPDEAARAVRQSKYPPEGNRSVGITRAHQYGATFQEYVNSANQQTAVIIQVEHIKSVQNLEKILEVSDVDALFVGPYDLSASLGKPGQIFDEEVQQAILRVKTACAERNFPVGIFARDAETGKAALEAGYTLVAVGLDSILFSAAARRVVKLLK
jgi:2-dehydro-3-deoxyglucarate aldolase/4-hydroxy-2-oxoheptanedioate aldolase